MTLPKGIRDPILFEDSSGKHLIAKVKDKAYHWIYEAGTWILDIELDEAARQMFYEKFPQLRLVA